ncbi:MAG: hypothetical protein ACK52L_00750 [Pirellula sp.]
MVRLVKAKVCCDSQGNILIILPDNKRNPELLQQDLGCMAESRYVR